MPQAPTIRTTILAIMRTPAFQRGVEDARADRRPSFDNKYVDLWEYERGRQFAMVAPRKMKVMLKGEVNPKAVDLFRKLRRADDIL